MNIDIRYKLIELARRKTTWSYSQLNDQLQLGLNFRDPNDRERIGELLGEVSIFEYQRGRPLLSALIRHEGNDWQQGDGFFKLCGQLYHRNWEELKVTPNYEIDKISECYLFWKDNDNYKNYKDDIEDATE